MWPLLAIPITALLLKHKVSKATEKAVEQGTLEFREVVKNSMSRALFLAVAKWIVYLTLIFGASAVAAKFHARPTLVVAFTIVICIYSVYMFMGCRFLQWCVAIFQRDGIILNPFKLVYVYIYHEIYVRVRSEIDSKPVIQRALLHVFGPSKETLAREITHQGMKSVELWMDVALRLILWLIGWLCYCLVYRNVFLFATGIEFQAWWQPLIWPIKVLYNYLLQIL